MKKDSSRRDFLKKSVMGIGAGIFVLGNFQCPFTNKNQKLPNILWIVSEDNSASFLGCYGNKNATTPNLDKLSKEGITYDNAFSNAPVCAPMRNSIITGMYASTLGCHKMRSKYPIPKEIKFFPEYLRNAGYYCTNNAKEDYNTFKPANVWNESSDSAHYKNRKKGQPFFAVFNTSLSHEHKIHFNELIDKDKLKHDPAKLEIAPYHPDLPEIRHCYANYYDYISKMDGKVGALLRELDESGHADDTIVFYYSDHGGVLPRSKRSLFESGTKIPLIVRFPEKCKHLASGKPGTRNDRLVSLVDLAPTLLNILDVKIPERFSGQAFLGEKRGKGPEYVHFFRNRMDERYDMMRAVRDKKFRYIRNYMPHRKYGSHLWYLWRSNSTRTWEKTFKAGKCNEIQSRFWGYKKPEELYDCNNDPHNINNLAKNPAYKEVLIRMGKENMHWIRANRDAGFIPEGYMIEKAGEKTIYEMKEAEDFPIERIIETAEIATIKNKKYLPELIMRFSDREPAVRYWAATGCAVLRMDAETAKPKLKKLLKDPIADVRIAAAEGLCNMGYKKESLNLLISEMKNKNPRVQLHAINVLDALEDDAKLVIKEIMSWLPWDKSTDDFFHQAYTQLVKKLKPDWGDYTIW